MKTLEIDRNVWVCLLIIPSEVIFSASGRCGKASDCFKYPKNPKIKPPKKKNRPNFPTQKNHGIENFKPEKILRSSPSLEV